MLKKDLGLFILILVVSAVVAFLNPRFLSQINISNTANQVGLFGIFSIGEGFVIITGGIDLSVGSQFALLGVLVTRMRMQPFVVTLCGLLIYRGVARYITGDGNAGFAFGETYPWLDWLTKGKLYGVIPHTFIAFALVAIVMGVVLHRTVFGRYLFAVGKNEEAARYSGINTRRVIAAAYIICGALTGLASVFMTMYVNGVTPSVHGNFYELYGIAAAERH